LDCEVFGEVCTLDIKEEVQTCEYDCSDWQVDIEAWMCSRLIVLLTYHVGLTIYHLHHRQDTLSVNAPPSNGPITEEIPKTAPKNPWNIGRFANGIVCTIMTTVPENRPAEPRPAMARPTMRAFDVGAEPQMADPTSKRAIQDLWKYQLHVPGTVVNMNRQRRLALTDILL